MDAYRHKDRQQKRFSSGSPQIVRNVDMRVGEIRQFRKLQDEGWNLIQVAMSQMKTSQAKRKTGLRDRRPGGVEENQSAHLVKAQQG